jgi:hypothetical protein
MDFFDQVPLAQRHGSLALPPGILAGDANPSAISITSPDVLPATNP